MKRVISKVFAITLIVFTTISCNDYLELLPPQSLVQDEYWQTKEHVQSVLMGAYKKAAQMDETYFILGELRADNVGFVIPRGDNQDTKNNKYFMHMGQILPQNSLFEWTSFYEVINICNYVLEFSPEVLDRDNTFTELQYLGYRAEAYFLRSLMYFYLVRAYGEVPLVLNAAKTDNQEFSLPKVHEDTVLNIIKKDLINARNFVTDEYGDLENNKGRASKAAMDALLADIYLWQEDYENCIFYCDQIDQTKYVLLPGVVWFENFYPGNSLESIFEFQLGADFETPNKLFDRTFSSNNIEYLPYRETIYLDLWSDNYEISQDRIRAAGTVDFIGSRIIKYAYLQNAIGANVRSGSQQKAANWIVYRMADVMLMKAEALVQLNRLEEAYDILVLIRDRVFASLLDIPQNASQVSKEQMELLILQERNLELAFEGKRWWDLMRFGRRNNFANKETFINIANFNLPANTKLVLNNRMLDPNSWFLPITESELERNINLEQNPYYVPFTRDRKK